MKNLITKTVSILFIALVSFTGAKVSAQVNDKEVQEEQKQEIAYNKQSEKEMVLTFQGITENDNYQFIDSKGKVIVFQDEDAEAIIPISLYDDAFIGKKFKIGYKYAIINQMNEGGVASGKTIKVMRITSLNMLSKVRSSVVTE